MWPRFREYRFKILPRNYTSHIVAEGAAPNSETNIVLADDAAYRKSA